MGTSIPLKKKVAYYLQPLLCHYPASSQCQIVSFICQVRSFFNSLKSLKVILTKLVFQNVWSNLLKRSVVWVAWVETPDLNQLQMPIKHLISAFNPHFTSQLTFSKHQEFFHLLLSNLSSVDIKPLSENRTCIRLNYTHKILRCHACFRRPVIISFICIDW